MAYQRTNGQIAAYARAARQYIMEGDGRREVNSQLWDYADQLIDDVESLLRGKQGDAGVYPNQLAFDTYQKLAHKTADYPGLGSSVLYPTLGLVGEAGEVAEKVKKIWRDKQPEGHTGLPIVIPNDDRQALMKELGDVLWYLGEISTVMGMLLGDIAQANLDKLQDRHTRNAIHGEGDNR